MRRAKSPIFFALLLTLLLGGGCAHTDKVKSEGTADFFGSSKVSRYKLENGLKILILEDHSAPVFAYQTWFNVGSRDEEKGLTGLAHLFEHMMFKETKTYKDGLFDKMLESAGAEGENAFTGRDYTGYVQSLPSDKLDLIAKLESDRMVNLLVNDASLDKEREVVQNERRFRNENNPDGQLYERLYELAYGKHSYHWPVIGYENDLKNAKSAQCLAFYKRFYAPNNATIVVVGDVSPSTVLSTIEKYYGALPASKIDRPARPKEPVQTAERTETKELKTAVEKFMLGYHIPEMRHEDFAAIEVLRNILGSGRSSRLYKKLVDGGIATNVDVETAEHYDPGLFMIMANMQKGKTAQAALKAIDNEIRAIVAGRVTDQEIARAVALHRFGVFDGMSNGHAKAHFIGFYETVGGSFERGVKLINELKQVDRAAVQRVARAYLRTENRTVIIGVPKVDRAAQTKKTNERGA